MEIAKVTGLPIVEGLEEAVSLPHTIAYAISYRTRIDGLQELPEDKRPPRNLWDKPFKLNEFIKDVFDPKGNKSGNRHADLNIDDLE